MGVGAVITIDYSVALGINAFSPSPSNSNDMFSGILNPLRNAKTAGSVIKSELHDIATKIDIATSIGKFFSSDEGEYKLQSEISEEAKSAKGEEEVIYGALTNVESKLMDFGTTVIEVDNKAALLIRERKLEFNRRYPHLESETEYRQRMDERSGWEKTGDFLYGFVHGYGLIGGIDSLINGRERFEQHKEAIEQKIAEFATKTWNWVKENWEAIVAAIVVVAAAIVCIATFGAGTVFLVASLAAFAYAVADKIVAINNNGNGIVQTLEANGFHHLSQICKGFNWGLQITMLISGFGMEGASSLSFFEGSGFLATVGNGAIFGGGYNLAVDLTAHSLNFAYSKDAQSDPLGYLKFAFKDTLKDTVSGFVIGGTVAGISYSAVKGMSFFRSKFSTPHNNLKIGDDFSIVNNGDGTFNVNGKTMTKNELINPKTGEFKYKYGEMNYSSDDVFNNLYQKNSVSNQQSRVNIQRNAVENQLQKNPDYFKQFGCNETNTNKIVDWFQKNDSLLLHETLNNKVQIVPKGLNATVPHAGGTSLETLRINSEINYEKYIDQIFHDPSSPLRNKTLGEMQNIYENFNNQLYTPNNYNIENLKTQGKEKFIRDIFGFDVP